MGRVIGGVVISASKVFVGVYKEKFGYGYGPYTTNFDPKTINQISINVGLENRNLLTKEIKSEFKKAKVDVVSVAMFGPFRSLDIRSDNYGILDKTQPQNIWPGVNIYKALSRNGLGLCINTDVNMGAVGEFYRRRKEKLFPFNKNLENNENFYPRASTMLAYIVIGAGVGGGFTWGGYRVRDHVHPEMGHVTVVRHPKDKSESRCPYHPSCVEGLAGAKAHIERLGLLNDLELAEDIRADYIAQLVVAVRFILAPTLVVLSGPPGGRKLEEQGDLLAKVRKKFKEKLGGYAAGQEIVDAEQYIASPVCSNAALEGAIWSATEEFSIISKKVEMRR